MKFGQILSTRRDLLPPDVAIELSLLQDRVAPFPGAEAQRAIEEFTKREASIEQPKLTLKDVAPAGLSPMELVALEPMLIGLESV